VKRSGEKPGIKLYGGIKGAVYESQESDRKGWASEVLPGEVEHPDFHKESPKEKN
jgi:hypothetical protein